MLCTVVSQVQLQSGENNLKQWFATNVELFYYFQLYVFFKNKIGGVS